MNKRLKKIRCLIVEDEPIAQELVQDYMARIPSLELVAIASSVPQAIKCFQNTENIDLVFLDIRLPKYSGFDLLEFLPDPLPIIIITSAYRKYAIKGFEHAVFEFLVKPFEFERFSDSIVRVEQRLGIVRDFLPNAENEDIQLTTNNHLFVKVDRTKTLLDFEKINFIESMDNYAKFYFQENPNKFILVKTSLANMLQLLPGDSFTRISRRHIVRINQVVKITNNTLTLRTHHELSIGVTFKDTVKEIFQFS